MFTGSKKPKKGESTLSSDATHPALILAAAFPFSASNQAAVNAYLTACSEFETRLNQLHSDRRELLAGAANTTVGEIQKRGEALRSARPSLEMRLAELAWERFDLRKKLLPDAAAAAEQADGDYKAAIGEERKALAAEGVTADSMQAGGGAFLEAAERQFELFLKDRSPCLAAKARLNIANTVLTAWKSGVDAAPSVKSCSIAWGPAPQGTELVARMAGVDE